MVVLGTTRHVADLSRPDSPVAVLSRDLPVAALSPKASFSLHAANYELPLTKEGPNLGGRWRGRDTAETSGKGGVK